MKRDPWGLRVVAWLRRIIVSFGVGGTSYVLMLAFMVASVVYDRELEPVVTFDHEPVPETCILVEGATRLNGGGEANSQGETP